MSDLLHFIFLIFFTIILGCVMAWCVDFTYHVLIDPTIVCTEKK